jgi:hypothetical protein
MSFVDSAAMKLTYALWVGPSLQEECPIILLEPALTKILTLQIQKHIYVNSRSLQKS